MDGRTVKLLKASCVKNNLSRNLSNNNQGILKELYAYPAPISPNPLCVRANVRKIP